MPFEYWNLPKSDNITTRITRCYKDGKYIVFTRDDGKECKYDLSTGEVIGFRGKPVKRLANQLKDLTCKRLFEITDNPTYKQFFEWVWKWHPNGKAWVFFEFTMPNYRDHEQYFTSPKAYTLGYRFEYGYSQIPKGLFKFCETYNLDLTNELTKSYLKNPDAFNLLYSFDFHKCKLPDVVKAMIYGSKLHITTYYNRDAEVINENDLLMRKIDTRPKVDDGRDAYFISLISDFGYNAKLLLKYIDGDKIKRRFKRDIFRDIYDYADMMTQLYDSYDRYPEDFQEAHKRACEEYNRMSIQYDEVEYETEYTERNVLDYECEIDGFKFIYPRTTEEIKEEGRNQHNCVSTYIDRVLREHCHIMFMRPIDNLGDSYITIEICDNKIVQAKRKYNTEPSKEEYEIIRKWNEKYKDFELR